VFLLVFLSALGAWIGFDNPLFHFPLAILLFPLGLAGIGLRATSWKSALKFSWMAGLLACIGCFYWMVIPVQSYGGLPWYLALPCPILLAAFLALYYSLFSLLIYHASRRADGLTVCITAGLSWASMEMLMGSMFSGFPWMNIASAFASWPIAIQGASILGAYGLSGLLAILSVAMLFSRTDSSTIILAIGISAIILLFGFFRLQTFSQDDPSYTLSIVQGNVDQGQKWDPKFQAETVQKYIKLSTDVVQKLSPQIVVWPETAMPFYLQDASPYQTALEKLAQTTKTNFIIGSPAYRVIDLKTRKYVLLNRAWLMDDMGLMMQSYDKEHLVPFGEYMPFANILPFDQLVQAAGNFVPGTQNKPIIVDGVALGMLICYEAIFTELAQHQVEQGATVLLNISNDAWFGNTSAPKQHFDLSIMRAVEQGRWLVRSTNNGISAFIDPLGRICSKSKQFQTQSLTQTVTPLTKNTVYHNNFSQISFGIYTLTTLVCLWLFIGVRKKDIIRN